VLLVPLALTAKKLEGNLFLGTLTDSTCFVDTIAVLAMPDNVEGRHECRIISYMRVILAHHTKKYPGSKRFYRPVRPRNGSASMIRWITSFKVIR